MNSRYTLALALWLSVAGPFVTPAQGDPAVPIASNHSGVSKARWASWHQELAQATLAASKQGCRRVIEFCLSEHNLDDASVVELLTTTVKDMPVRNTNGWIGSVKKACSQSPSAWTLALLLGELYAKDKRYRQAASEFAAAERLCPSHASEISYEAAVAFDKCGDAEQAYTYISNYKSMSDHGSGAAAHASNWQQVLTVRVTNGLKLGKDAEILADVNQLMRMDPDKAKLLSWRAQVYTHLQRPLEAQQDLQEALVLSPERTDVRNQLISVLLSENRYDSALAHLVILIKSDPDNKTYRKQYASTQKRRRQARRLETAPAVRL